MKRGTNKGFSLLELLLVMVVASMLVVMLLKYMERSIDTRRIDKTVTQLQVLLDAGLAYYQKYDRWPGPNDSWQTTSTTSSSALQPEFLPAMAFTNPYGLQAYYWHAHYTSNYIFSPANTFQVAVYIGTSTRQTQIANIIAGRLPFAYVSGGYVYAYVPIPTNKLNNMMSIKFAGVYHHGACIPVPDCPTSSGASGMNTVAQVYVAPVSVSGVNDSGNTNVYPISSFTAYATGGTNNNPALCTNQTAVTPSSTCTGGGTNNMYWRACLQVVTERGNVAVTRTDNWGQYVSMAAFTRCASANQPSGSTFSVYGN